MFAWWGRRIRRLTPAVAVVVARGAARVRHPVRHRPRWLRDPDLVAELAPDRRGHAVLGGVALAAAPRLVAVDRGAVLPAVAADPARPRGAGPTARPRRPDWSPQRRCPARRRRSSGPRTWPPPQSRTCHASTSGPTPAPARCCSAAAAAAWVRTRPPASEGRLTQPPLGAGGTHAGRRSRLHDGTRRALDLHRRPVRGRGLCSLVLVARLHAVPAALSSAHVVGAAAVARRPLVRDLPVVVADPGVRPGPFPRSCPSGASRRSRRRRRCRWRRSRAASSRSRCAARAPGRCGRCPRRAAWSVGAVVLVVAMVVAANSTELTVQEQVARSSSSCPTRPGRAGGRDRPPPVSRRPRPRRSRRSPRTPRSTTPAPSPRERIPTVDTCGDTTRVLVVGDSTGRGAANGLKRPRSPAWRSGTAPKLGCGMVERQRRVRRLAGRGGRTPWP